MGFLRRLDDRLIGKAERDPAARRRADTWANGLLLLIGTAVAIAFLLSDSHNTYMGPAVYTLIGALVVRALLRITRTRR